MAGIADQLMILCDELEAGLVQAHTDGGELMGCCASCAGGVMWESSRAPEWRGKGAAGERRKDGGLEFICISPQRILLHWLCVLSGAVFPK